MGNQAPANADASDQGCRRGGRAEVEGEERSRLALHVTMLTGRKGAVAGGSRDVVGRKRPSGVPGHLVVGILKPLDELLDPDVVGQDLAGHRQSAPEDAMKDRVEEDHCAAAERSIGAAGLQEEDRRYRQAAQLDLARSALHEVVSLLF